jgi:hypothetical protein
MFGLGRDSQQHGRALNKRVQEVVESTKPYDMLENFPAGA